MSVFASANSAYGAAGLGDPEQRHMAGRGGRPFRTSAPLASAAGRAPEPLRRVRPQRLAHRIANQSGTIGHLGDGLVVRRICEEHEPGAEGRAIGFIGEADLRNQGGYGKRRRDERCETGNGSLAAPEEHVGEILLVLPSPQRAAKDTRKGLHALAIGTKRARGDA